MSIVLFRIDDRLIHGQVVEGWLNYIDVDILLLANDTVANDVMQRTLMEMAIPQEIEIFIDSVNNIIKVYSKLDLKNKNIMILVASPKDAYRLVDAGIYLPSINVGGIHFSSGKAQILEFISVDENDCKYFHLLSDKGVKLDGRPLPSSEKIDILKDVCRYESIKGSEK
ncbi:MAG: PTS sugar transporter subunit IIB [bacterium]|nr:PTS sugar transporter subunit IIB [bacterium]